MAAGTAEEQRLKRARRALIADGWGWEVTPEEARGPVRARAYPTSKVRCYESADVQDRSVVSVLTDNQDHAVLHLARLTGALQRYERVTRRRRTA
ncbi:MAG TPA: hypothetical protein VNM48_15635 [Chloroflexota bacterium]|nr:hypothetical protein [Chloroflexota bacterium]